MQRLDNTVCLVARGSKGTAKATCKGAKVVMADVQDEDGQSRRDRIFRSSGIASLGSVASDDTKFEIDGVCTVQRENV